MINVMITWRECAVPPLKPANIHSSAYFLNYRNSDADSVTIWARRPVRPSGYSSIVEKFEFSTVEAKGATPEMERCKLHRGSPRTGEDDQTILLAHCSACYTMHRQVGAVKVKAKVKVG